MSLEANIREILKNFDHTSSENFLRVLEEIQPSFKSPLISEYLQGKIQKILDSELEEDKKKQCKALTPYFDWYLQGL
ncbi:hypothetical protein [Nitrosopumilus sp.]|uniref:hypothetical protein n=1 Tax=Nitrosopumilus sp. TaxID=2024843 RepID=UPI00247B9280|nr:hypothetical protein [Nitrosopumilus sp.]MCV0429955.1 hypothetical protein [Nitrosopumilus sp.]